MKRLLLEATAGLVLCVWAVLACLLAGCGASMNVMQKPQGPGSVPKGQPYMMLVVSGVDLSAQGLYLAPNIIPALQPPLVQPGQAATATPVALGASPSPTPTATPTDIDKALQGLWNSATGGNQ